MKKAGKINVDEMRLIMLMHPEYQINNKNIGRKVLANAEICNEVAKEQHGSRKNHQAGLLLLNKVLVGDLFCLTKFSGCYAMNNAKECYDRINHNFAILTLMFFGVPWMIACTLFLVLQRASHSIKQDMVFPNLSMATMTLTTPWMRLDKEMVLVLPSGV